MFVINRAEKESNNFRLLVFSVAGGDTLSSAYMFLLFI